MTMCGDTLGFFGTKPLVSNMARNGERRWRTHASISSCQGNAQMLAARTLVGSQAVSAFLYVVRNRWSCAVGSSDISGTWLVYRLTITCVAKCWLDNRGHPIQTDARALASLNG